MAEKKNLKNTEKYLSNLKGWHQQQWNGKNTRTHHKPKHQRQTHHGKAIPSTVCVQTREPRESNASQFTQQLKENKKRKKNKAPKTDYECRNILWAYNE